MSDKYCEKIQMWKRFHNLGIFSYEDMGDSNKYSKEKSISQITSSTISKIAANLNQPSSPISHTLHIPPQ